MPRSPKKLQLDRIGPDLPPREFFAKYVAKRQPVVIKGLLDDADFHGRKWTDLSYLAQKAGDVDVTVEPIHPSARQYGTAVERIPMPFRDFLASLASDNGGEAPPPYLTTQYSDDDPDVETVFPPPTNALRDDFPVVPHLMGNLFLQQVNLWLGMSKVGSSSGLHHDFHDNLYCLLQGRKRFVLFPPSEVHHLSPHGTLAALHPNGLITYKEHVSVRADGLSQRTACTARVRALELQIDALRAKEAVSGNSGKRRSKEKEKEKEKEKGKVSREMRALVSAHDEALDELALVALEEREGGDGGNVDDFDALMGGLEDGDEDDGFPGAGPSAGRQQGAGVKDEDGDEDSEEEEEEEEEWKGIGHSDADSESGDSNGSPQKVDDRPGEPSSFSRIPTAHLHGYLDLPTTAVLPPGFSSADFPGLSRTTAPYVVELSAGEMLYLPASWWHEVTSTSAASHKDARHSVNGGGGVHMAFNYWFYPPDALDSFEAPYSDSLVWGYLREKAGLETVGTAAERVQLGKREREKGRYESSKKAQR